MHFFKTEKGKHLVDMEILVSPEKLNIEQDNNKFLKKGKLFAVAGTFVVGEKNKTRLNIRTQSKNCIIYNYVYCVRLFSIKLHRMKIQ